MTAYCYLCYLFAATALFFTGCRSQCDGSVKTLDVTTRGIILTSPGYGNGTGYPANAHCEWRIEPTDGNAVYILVNTMDLGGLITSNCTTDDRVAIFNGLDPSYGTPVFRLCRRRDEGRHFYSSEPYLHVKFTSDGTVSGTGFQLEIRSADRPRASTTAKPKDVSSDEGSSFSRVGLILGLCGASVVLSGLAFFIRKYCRSSSSVSSSDSCPNHASPPGPRSPHHAHSSQPAPVSSHAYQDGGGNRISSSGLVPSAPCNERPNSGYSTAGDAPPSYDFVMDGGGSGGQPGKLPSYSEAVAMSELPPKPE